MKKEVLSAWEFKAFEKNAWSEIIKEFKRQFKMNDKEINDEKLGPLFHAIDVWGDEYARLRIVQREKGTFDVMERDGTLL